MKLAKLRLKKANMRPRRPKMRPKRAKMRPKRTKKATKRRSRAKKEANKSGQVNFWRPIPPRTRGILLFWASSVFPLVSPACHLFCVKHPDSAERSSWRAPTAPQEHPRVAKSGPEDAQDSPNEKPRAVFPRFRDGFWSRKQSPETTQQEKDRITKK